jgi:glutamate synthase domain-containing protein 3
MRIREDEAAERAMDGDDVEVTQRLTNVDRSVGVAAAGKIARAFGDGGLPAGRLRMRHRGAAGHFYAAYALPGMEFRMEGVVADSCFTAAYGGRLVVAPEADEAVAGLTLVGNTFGYGARGGRAYIAGRAGNRFGICLRKGHEGDAPRVVVEGVAANAFQYMTGGVALVLGPAGFNLGAGMTGGVVYLLDHDPGMLSDYVAGSPLTDADLTIVRTLLDEHLAETGSRAARALLDGFDPARFVRVATRLKAEAAD